MVINIYGNRILVKKKHGVSNPAGIYLLKGNNRNIRARTEISLL